jgi:hypothetical protein
MKRSEVITNVEEMKNYIAYLGKECVDDPVQVMISFAANSAQFVESLEYCLRVLNEDKSEGNK